MSCLFFNREKKLSWGRFSLKFKRETKVCMIQHTLEGQSILMQHKWRYDPYFIDDHLTGKKKEIFREICVNCGFVSFVNYMRER